MQNSWRSHALGVFGACPEEHPSGLGVSPIPKLRATVGEAVAHSRRYHAVRAAVRERGSRLPWNYQMETLKPH